LDVAFDAHGRGALAWVEAGSPHGYKMNYSVWSNGSWSTPEVIEPEYAYGGMFAFDGYFYNETPQISMSDDGNGVMVFHDVYWYGFMGTTYSHQIQTKQWLGGKFEGRGYKHLVGWGNNPAISMGPDRNARFIYSGYPRSTAALNGWGALKTNEWNQYNETIGYNFSTTSPIGDRPAIKFGPDGMAFAVWENDTAAGIQYAIFYGNSYRTGYVSTTGGGASFTNYNPDIAITLNGTPVAVWEYDTLGQIDVEYSYYDFSSGTWSTAAAVEAGFNTVSPGPMPTVAVDSKDRVFIFYTDNINSDIRYKILTNLTQLSAEYVVPGSANGRYQKASFSAGNTIIAVKDSSGSPVASTKIIVNRTSGGAAVCEGYTDSKGDMRCGLDGIDTYNIYAYNSRVKYSVDAGTLEEPNRITIMPMPTLLSVQGRLTNTTGVLQDGNFNFTFQIFDAPTAGNLVWTEYHAGANLVPVKRGLFSTVLGSITGLNLIKDMPYYLEVNVGGENLQPRYRILV
jgi:hypothetical protein